MHWITIVVIGIAANIDNLGVGITFGARSTRVPLVSNLFIAVLSAGAAFVTMTVGALLSQLFPVVWGNIIGGLILVALGGWGIRTQLVNQTVGQAETREHGAGAAPDNSTGTEAEQSDQEEHIVSRAESLSIGLALSINSMASSFGAGVSGVSPLLCSISIGLFSLLTVEAGVRIGFKFAHSPLGKYAGIIGCVLLILIGCYEIIF
ncbi:manganese efflux pump [Paenibacillus sp. PR3]|uniref:Manganese efflux pump n=1 Tax=Paenibacillus terricola TaxID=2763503 RepID=A0ABR8N3H8_9BACL|nr:manganese efflux pump [Paenibacillus terricola]MBD3921952.1 manganese efflux pump [Paenibacillus terricola]